MSIKYTLFLFLVLLMKLMKKWFGRVWKLCEELSFGYAATIVASTMGLLRCNNWCSLLCLDSCNKLGDSCGYKTRRAHYEVCWEWLWWAWISVFFNPSEAWPIFFGQASDIWRITRQGSLSLIEGISIHLHPYIFWIEKKKKRLVFTDDLLQLLT